MCRDDVGKYSVAVRLSTYRYSSNISSEFSIFHLRQGDKMNSKLHDPKIFRLLAVFSFSLILLTKCGLTPTKQSIERDIQRFMRKEHVPSVSIAVATEGKIVWEQSYGFSDRETQIKATPNTLYNLASISKVYTSTAIMALVEQGLIELDAPVDQYERLDLTDYL